MKDFLEWLAPIWRPHQGQKEFLASPAKIKVLACGRRWGKTDACAVQILRSLRGLVPTKHLILAPTLDQAKLLFDRVLEFLDQLFASDEEQDEQKVKRTPFPLLLFRGHRVSARSGHVGRSLRGNEATHIVVDEAAFVPEALVAEVAMPMLATTDGSLTLISTPRGLNHFWRFFSMGQKGEHGIWSRQAPSQENPRVNPNFLDVQRELISPLGFAVEYEAEFLELEGKVFRGDAIIACTVVSLPENRGSCYVGVDWGQKVDSTAVVVVQGDLSDANVVEVDTCLNQAWADIVARVALTAERYPNAAILCDASGGNSITEMLRDALPDRRVTGFAFSREKKNLLIDGLRGMFERNAIKMQPHPGLIKELENFEYRPDGKVEARSGYHDDMVIALGLAVSQLNPPRASGVQLAGSREF